MRLTIEIPDTDNEAFGPTLHDQIRETLEIVCENSRRMVGLTAEMARFDDYEAGLLDGNGNTVGKLNLTQIQPKTRDFTVLLSVTVLDDCDETPIGLAEAICDWIAPIDFPHIKKIVAYEPEDMSAGHPVFDPKEWTR